MGKGASPRLQSLRLTVLQEVVMEIPEWVKCAPVGRRHLTITAMKTWHETYAAIRMLKTSTDALAVLHCEMSGKKRRLVISRLYTRFRALRTAEHYSDLKPFIGKLQVSHKQNSPVCFP